MKIILIVIFGIILIMQLISARSTSKVETANYTVIKKYTDFEIRFYPEMIKATASIGNGSYSENSGNGFRTVAGYIFGGNDQNLKIAMTSPVMVEMSDTMKMSFVMPSQYSMEELPTPNNPRVDLHKDRTMYLAVLTYNGFSNSKRFNAKLSQLLTALERENLEVNGKPIYFGYNPPYEVINRRNEVAVEINF